MIGRLLYGPRSSLIGQNEIDDKMMKTIRKGIRLSVSIVWLHFRHDHAESHYPQYKAECFDGFPSALWHALRAEDHFG